MSYMIKSTHSYVGQTTNSGSSDASNSIDMSYEWLRRTTVHDARDSETSRPADLEGRKDCVCSQEVKDVCSFPDIVQLRWCGSIFRDRLGLWRIVQEILE